MEEINLPSAGGSKILFDVFVSDPLIIDQFVYRAWLNGLTEKETVLRRQATNTFSPSTSGTLMDPSFSGLNTKNMGLAPASVSMLLLHEVEDQFRNFKFLEHILENPPSLTSQTTFQLSPSIQRYLIENYYQLEDGFLREILGKKLTPGLRRDLGEISEKTKIRLNCCHRYFDNLRRVQKVVLQDIHNSAVDVIHQNFMINKELAAKYTRTVFMCFHRFDTGKKRLQFLSYADFDRFAGILMANWGDPLKTGTIEIDSRLKDDVRDLKAYLLSTKDITERYRKLVKTRFQTIPTPTPLSSNPPSSSTPIPQIPTSPSTVPTASSSLVPPLYSSSPSSSLGASTSGSIMSEQKLRELEQKFKHILKALLSIGANISESKEFKNIFEDMIDSIAEPCRRIGMSLQEVDQLILHIAEVFDLFVLDLLGLKHRQRFAQSWRRYLEGIRLVLIQMYAQFFFT